MPTFLENLRQRPLLTDGGMGSYLFELTGRLSEQNHVYESFPADKPELICDIGYAYLQAGAQCLKTDTFGANRLKLAPYGLSDRTAELNEAGARVPHQAIALFQKQTSDDTPHYVLGSVGPLPDASLSDQEASDIYREQISGLLKGGVDAILLETFNNISHQLIALNVARELNGDIPVITFISPHRVDSSSLWAESPTNLVNTLIDAGASVVGPNCCSPWDAVEFIESIQSVPAIKNGDVLLGAMPNGGTYQRIDHRYMTRVNPEYMGKLARTFSDNGVKLIGGCCEVHPEHIREMHNYLRSRVVATPATQVPLQQHAMEPAAAAEKKGNGRFSEKLFNNEFVVSVEMLPPRGTSEKTLEKKIEFVKELADSGLADALDITDGSRGIPLMPPGDFVTVARQRLGWTAETGDQLEFIPHFTARDLNTMGIQSRLTGYHFNRIHNIIYITGDPPKMSPTYPRSSAVFDLNSTSMIRYTHQCLNSGIDYGGQPLGKHDDPRMHFTIGTGFEPEALKHDEEMAKLEQKIDNGADYVMTQPAFRFEPLDQLAPYRGKARFLIGVMILTSLKHALRVAEVPGVTIPKSVLDRLSQFEDPADQAKAALEFATEQVRWVKENGWDGLYLMSPSSHKPILDILSNGLDK